MTRLPKKITITRHCIKAGKASSVAYCPVALALKAAGLNHVSVHPSYARFSNGAAELHVPLPEKIQRFIETYDVGDPVRPTSFILKRSLNG